jgi:hypothetical protein
VQKSLGICLVLTVAVLTVLLSIANAAGLGDKCGGILGIKCNADLQCELPSGKCGITDLTGSCVRHHVICPDIIVPVCGCDKITYGNDCMRVWAGVSKDHDDACK